MKITIQFEAQLREVAGQSEVSLDVADDTNLRQVLEEAAADNDTLRERLFAGDSLSASLMVFVNDQPIAGDANDHSLNDGATVLLLPPISGG